MTCPTGRRWWNQFATFSTITVHNLPCTVHWSNFAIEPARPWKQPARLWRLFARLFSLWTLLCPSVSQQLVAIITTFWRHQYEDVPASTFWWRWRYPHQLEHRCPESRDFWSYPNGVLSFLNIFHDHLLFFLELGLFFNDYIFMLDYKMDYMMDAIFYATFRCRMCRAGKAWQGSRTYRGTARMVMVVAYEDSMIQHAYTISLWKLVYLHLCSMIRSTICILRYYQIYYIILYLY